MPLPIRPSGPTLTVLVAAALLVGCGPSGPSAPATGSPQTEPSAPVEVAAVEHGPITLRRTFSGTLEPTAEVRVTPRVSGQLERLAVDIGDTVERGQIIAWINDDEIQQALAQSEADLAVARANRAEAEASAKIASRALERLESLREQGVASESELDAARATSLARESMLAVSAARILRAEASLEAVRLRLRETRVIAHWESSEIPAEDATEVAPDTRLVARRFVDEGALVDDSAPLISIVALKPIVAVVFVPERDYSRLVPGLSASVTTDAYSGETFIATVARIAPVFSSSTRQVRVELEIPNADLRLKPGMFVRATLELAHEDNATIVPFGALTTRGDRKGVFLLPPGADTVRWTPVEVGIRDDRRVQLVGAPLEGQVVTLGQELCDDGSRVNVPASSRGPR